MAEKSRLRRTISKWANNDDQDARDLRAQYVGEGDVCIGDAVDRTLVTLVWLGRRRIAGIDPGRSMRVRGRVGRQDGVRIVYNPRYELMS